LPQNNVGERTGKGQSSAIVAPVPGNRPNFAIVGRWSCAATPAEPDEEETKAMFNRSKESESATPAQTGQAGRSRPAPPPNPTIAKPARPDIPGFSNPAPQAAEQKPEAVPTEPQGSKLIVGKDIHLRGEITSCDVLVVEGKVEASMNSRYIGIADSGVFEGDCEIDTADISGRFDGNLTVRERLIVRENGRVTGTIRYGEIQIEAGGVIAGDVQVTGTPKPVAKPADEAPKAAEASAQTSSGDTQESTPKASSAAE
jgi:cytoskeletal protein CcmA (bactofilin family)